MAATRLIALHKNKGKSVATCLKSRTDYAQNPEKTKQGELVSSYECSPLTVDEEFMLSKRQYELMTGRRQKNDVIAYQIRQSFKPGEITAEEANKVGYELAMRFTKGKYAFIVATHTDREHIHNHIIYNSTALDSTRKFRDFLLSGLAVQRLSDLICLEHQLSVIEIKPYRERQKRTLYPPRESNRDKLCAVIDNILLNEKPADFEAFLQKLEQQGYEIKRGKHTSVKGTRQKRFIRFRTLGAGYSEDEIKAVIAGDAEHCPHQKQPPKEQLFHLLVDIQAKLSEGKSEGYARWAKKYNLKEMSKTLIFLQEKKIGSIKEMQERVDAATARYHELGDSIKAAETRMAEIAVLRTHIVNYAKTRPVYDAYRKAGYSKRFLENHRAEITLHKAAKAAFDESNLKTLPKVKELDAQQAEAEAQANAVIRADAPVRCWYPAPEDLAKLTYRSKKEIEGQVRIVTIPGADVCACCGTHTRTTGQVGQIKILASENYKGGVRLSVVCGQRALLAAQAMRQRQAEIGALLSAKADQTAVAVHRIYDEYTALKFTHFGLCSQLFDALAQLVNPGEDAIRTVPGLDPDGLHRLAVRLTEATTGLCAALTPTEKGTGYCIAQADGDVRALTKALNAALNGRGGGKPGICQGSCAAAPEQVEEFLREQNR